MNSSITLKHQIKATLDDRQIFGLPKSRSDVMDEIRENPDVYQIYQKLSADIQNKFMEFCMGVRGLSITYDPIFKKIFNTETHPERLEDFLCCCLGQKVTIIKTMPNESERLTEEGSLLVMDILVKLENGSLVNVEIQRLGYLFPGARCACYSSDLMMRQYTQIRAEKRVENSLFSYQDIKPVYTIVLIQKSTKEFHSFPEHHLHYAKQTFNTGLKVDMLQEYLLIPLDILKAKHQNISTKLDAWLYFIASDNLEDIRQVIEAFPDFRELYQEVFQFRYQMKEMIFMYSESLKILDANTVQYMVELQQQQIEEQKAQLEAQQAQLEAQQAELEAQQAELEVLRAQQAEFEALRTQ